MTFYSDDFWKQFRSAEDKMDDEMIDKDEKSCPDCGSTETEQDWNGNLRCAQCGK